MSWVITTSQASLVVRNRRHPLGQKKFFSAT
jgi:hypothetical protein